MDQAGIKEVCDAIITRPGFKQFMSGEIARQLKEANKPKKETAISKSAGKRETAVKK